MHGSLGADFTFVKGSTLKRGQRGQLPGGDCGARKDGGEGLHGCVWSRSEDTHCYAVDKQLSKHRSLQGLTQGALGQKWDGADWNGSRDASARYQMSTD